jgi:hypothetical protein
MRHPSDGTLRRLVDEPAAVADADREHVAGCAVCRDGLATAQADASVAAAALHFAAADTADVDDAWRRLSAAADRPGPVTPAARVPRWRKALRSPVIAGAAVAALLAGAGAAAAGDWLQVLRTEKIAPVTVHQADLLALPDLSDWGTVEITERPNIRRAGAAEAEKITGLPMPEVATLPRGVTGQPTLQVGDRIGATFTFSAARAGQWAKAAGHPLPPLPPGLDGSRFRLSAGPGTAAIWSESRGIPALIVARAAAPKAYSSGVPFATARDYLLSLSGLPEDVAAQLRRFTGDGTTLPVHVMPEKLTSSPTDVNGVPATLFRTTNGALAGVAWVQDGVVTLVAGSLAPDEVLTVARELRWRR